MHGPNSAHPVNATDFQTPARLSPLGRTLALTWVAVLQWAIACLMPLSSAAAETGYQVGTGRELITPAESMWMSGYGARTKPSDGKLTELWAKALAVEDQAGQRLVLVTLDLVGIDAGMSQRISEHVTAQYGLPREALVLSTTHTHSGPVVGTNLRAMYALEASAWAQVDNYTAELEAKVVRAIGAALESLEPVELHWTVGRAAFAVNRRNNPENEVPQLRQSDRLRGPVDHDVPILVVNKPDGTLRTIVCGYACHATVLSGYQWCGDWPGYAQIALEERFPGAMTMVWAGCGADQNPLPRRDLELAKAYGAAIDEAVAAALARPLIAISGPLQADYNEIPLAFAELPTVDQLRADAAAESHYTAGRAQLLLEQIERQGKLSPDYRYPVQTWQLGTGPTWVFLGGEVVVDYALRLKLELEGGKTWVSGYCNDVMAYIPSVRVLGEGGYEGGGAMLYYGLPSRWSPEIEEQIVGEVRRQVAALGGPAADAPRTIGSQPYPDHSDLSVWLDDDGQLQPIQSPADWDHRRQHILAAMQQVIGRLPPAEELPPLEVQELDRQEFPTYSRLSIRYRVDEGFETPAHLYLPKTTTSETPPPAATKLPAVLALHPTSHLGKRVVAGEGPLANRGYAVELAERGFVVLAPDYPSFGDLAAYNFYTDRYLSGTMAAIASHRRGVDLLTGHAQVDSQRIAVIGHSLGGHNAMFLGAFDERVKAIVSSCGWDPFHHYYGGKLAGWASDRYMPRIRELYGLDPDAMPFDFYEVAAALAPRGFFSCSPLRDGNFDAQGVKQAQPRIAEVYRLLGAEQRFVVQYPDSEHDFPPDTRLQAYEFLQQALNQETAASEN